MTLPELIIFWGVLVGIGVIASALLLPPVSLPELIVFWGVFVGILVIAGALLLWAKDQVAIRHRRALETRFHSFFERRGFQPFAEPSAKWMIGKDLTSAFRCEFFDLSLNGESGWVYGRPLYRQEGWCWIPGVFALLAGNSDPSVTESDLDRFASAIDERFDDLREFFSPRGEEMRSRFARWQVEYDARHSATYG